ncbi:uncharacterized protein LOC121880144 isoform X3 [Homarus americanus]|uniref:uncharacterized protein LOC121880144 isoform X3 n=1 Tax=Homarus americanus TaxID=6706 RepID=UPI001C44F486|nr:uncharacterized protein LOC121880144 isoform X3 [Homarus americanus]
MAHSPEDIQNNNFQVEPNPVTTSPPTTAININEPVTSTSSFTSASLLAQIVARNLDNLTDDTAPSSLNSIIYNDEYLEDPLPDLTLENLRIPEEYGDPSLGYEFVNNVESDFRLDNSEALLRHLEVLGVRVNEDYFSLDFDLTTSRSASVSSVSDTGSAEDHELVSQGHTDATTPRLRRTSPGHSRQKEHIGSEKLSRLPEDEDEVFLEIEDLDHEVAEAEILPSGGVKVTYENYKKEYRSRISPHHNFLKFLETVHSGVATDDTESVRPEAAAAPLTVEGRYRRVLLAFQRGVRRSDLRVRNLSAIPSKYAQKLRRFLAEEITYDTVTPDSGVHDTFNALSPEEQEKQREEWKAELTKTEEEIQTLRQVLGSKVKLAQDLKRRLGITVWREFTEDFNNSMKTVRESQTTQYVQSLPVVQKANEVITEIHEAVSSAPLYQKTAGAMSAVGEKTSSLFGGIGAKFGQLKETPTFKSFEERVGGVYSAARTRMGGSGSNSTQDFEEALKEAEGEKAALEAANGGTVQTSTTPGTDVSQPAAS